MILALAPVAFFFIEGSGGAERILSPLEKSCIRPCPKQLVLPSPQPGEDMGFFGREGGNVTLVGLLPTGH